VTDLNCALGRDGGLSVVLVLRPLNFVFLYHWKKEGGAFCFG